jgi:Ricin-type beta-trefoil lectin domain-like
MSGKCLDQVPGSSDGLNVTQWACHFGDNQLWHPQQAPGSNFFELVNKQSGRVLEVSGNESTQNGANIQTWTYDGSGDMKRQLVRH